jgi:transposase
MAPQSRSYQPEYTLRVAKMLTEQGLSLSQVSKDLALGETAVSNGVTPFRADTHGTPGMSGPR